VPAVDSRAEAPERTASERLVERGRALLAADSAAGAASVLERAVRVDPSNGRAYLELARARIRLGEPGVARGLLQRAAALLRPYPELEARVDSLQATLGGA
jgi:Tfp pilus assembly protein PilF